MKRRDWNNKKRAPKDRKNEVLTERVREDRLEDIKSRRDIEIRTVKSLNGDFTLNDCANANRFVSKLKKSKPADNKEELNILPLIKRKEKEIPSLELVNDLPNLNGTSFLASCSKKSSVKFNSFIPGSKEEEPKINLSSSISDSDSENDTDKKNTKSNKKKIKKTKAKKKVKKEKKKCVKVKEPVVKKNKDEEVDQNGVLTEVDLALLVSELNFEDVQQDWWCRGGNSGDNKVKADDFIPGPKSEKRVELCGNPTKINKGDSNKEPGCNFGEQHTLSFYQDSWDL